MQQSPSLGSYSQPSPAMTNSAMTWTKSPFADSDHQRPPTKPSPTDHLPIELSSTDHRCLPWSPPHSTACASGVLPSMAVFTSAVDAPDLGRSNQELMMSMAMVPLTPGMIGVNTATNGKVPHFTWFLEANPPDKLVGW